MSAAELRKAAETLRERVCDAKPGPWIVGYGHHHVWSSAPTGGGGIHGYVCDIDGHDEGCGCTVGAYIATMHPGVGLALADWLDAEAAIYEKLERVAIEIGHDGWKLTWGESTIPQSEALARLINGGAA